MSGDGIDMELLRDKPTLFYERLRRFLSERDADKVIEELVCICHHCWDADAGCGMMSEGVEL